RPYSRASKSTSGVTRRSGTSSGTCGPPTRYAPARPPLDDRARTMIRYAALWLLVRVGGRVPLAILDALAAGAGTLGWWASRRLREVTRDHMRHVLGPSAAPHAVDRAARECVRSAARGYAEFAHLPRLSPEI